MNESELRLRQWMRDFGHTSERPFVADLEDLLVDMAAMRMKKEAAERSREELKEIIDGYKAIVEDLQKDRDRFKDALERIGNTAAIHYAGGAFDPEHMRAIGNCALSAINNEPFSWGDYPVPHVVADNDRLAGELEAARKKLSAILECWIDGIGAIDNSWRRRMAELVGDVDGLAEAKRDGTEDRIAALERQNAELREALRPFRWVEPDVQIDDSMLLGHLRDLGGDATVGDSRRAAALLGERKEGE